VEQEARAHADWYQQQMAFFEQSRQDVQRAVAGRRKPEQQQAQPKATGASVSHSRGVGLSRDID